MVEVSLIANIANNTFKASCWLFLTIKRRFSFEFVQGIFLEVKESNSLIAPVQSYSDVAFDFPDLILGQVAWKQLSPQINQLVHHVTELVKEVYFMLLWRKKNEQESQIFISSIHSRQTSLKSD